MSYCDFAYPSAADWAYYDKDTLAPKPKLIIPPTLLIDGVDRFHIAALDEPAMTGFVRFFGTMENGAEHMPKGVDYVRFLGA